VQSRKKPGRLGSRASIQYIKETRIVSSAKEITSVSGRKMVLFFAHEKVFGVGPSKAKRPTEKSAFLLADIWWVVQGLNL